ncbi:MAG TPA: hypothetical protein DC061_13620 [Gemmobacter sp.]|nr:hypothetical protein [Gemmobacter sp.]
MSGIDWPGLLRVGLHQLRLEPAVFWRLTPVELRIMLGVDRAAAPLTRSRLDELAAAFPDGRRPDDGGCGKPAGSGGGAGGDAGQRHRHGGGL